MSMKIVLVLNSAQSRYPRGGDAWVQATVAAFDRLAGTTAVALVSTSPLMWDFAAFLAAASGMRIRFIIPDFDRGNAERKYRQLLTDFTIAHDRAEPVFLDTPRAITKADVWRLRDLKALHMADVIYPVAITPEGRLDTLMRTESLKGEVRDTFRIDYSDKKPRMPRYDFASSSVNSLRPGNWLVHWTRSSPGPWPGETASSFFRDMLAQPDRYVRSARDTLMKILAERVIRSSTWKIPGTVPVVSLTENTPESALTLVKWRKRFVRYTYEPYGIAIRREALEPFGARAVTYAVSAPGPDMGMWWYQSPGAIADWTREQEWRHPGDIRLDAIDPKDWFPVVPGQPDAEYIGDTGIGKTFVLFGG
jgi:hypothetical protein